MQRSAVRPSPVFLGLLLLTVGGGFLATVEGDTARQAGVFVLVAAGWVVSLCLHEFGHAIVAYRGGDREVLFKGYLTLDPRRYTDPVLSLVLPLLFLAIGGLPLPGGAVWINRHALRSRAVCSSMSLAGPIANLVVAFLLAVGMGILTPDGSLARGAAVLDHPVLAGLSFLATLQLAAFLINILPIPGLDGWGALEPYLSYEARKFGAKAQMWAPFILFAVLIAVPPVNEGLWYAVSSIYDAFGGNLSLASYGQDLFFFWRSF
ncbi:site-2 protease family protein [Actinokineospora auranticolor]|uniref:site-2 protease family protein n=1 Tax=Actinokineospora auranticolor TaxID=155976 RepID=UPI000CEBFBEF|nr:site-2 protease family protein [Actinokineospora auranticolor]